MLTPELVHVPAAAGSLADPHPDLGAPAPLEGSEPDPSPALGLLAELGDIPDPAPARTPSPWVAGAHQEPLTPDAEPLAREALRIEAVEQVMRMTTDETLVYAILPALTPARAAIEVGRIITALPEALSPGCPLLAYGAGTAVDHTWRVNYPALERSLYSELLFSRLLSGHADEDPGEHEDAFDELEKLRDLLGFPVTPTT